MTQEEKLEEAKRLYETANADQKYVLERLFPELKESEDERIIERIKKAVESYWSEEPLDEILAWLEKQGKNNMGISEATKQKLEDNLNKALEKETPESWNKFLDEQGEQKSAWSEEDERNLNDAIDACKAQYGNMSYTADWLLSFKDRVQPKQEWSEEDEEELKIALDTLEKAGQHSSATWLKNVCLVPQSHWKPSDEQMKALKDALNDAICQYDFKGSLIKEEVTRKHAETIESLYNDLKKLKGE